MLYMSFVGLPVAEELPGEVKLFHRAVHRDPCSSFLSHCAL